MNCAYCGKENSKGYAECVSCGAPEYKTTPDPRRSGPMFYNGYVVYEIADCIRRDIDVVFYLGTTLVARIVVPEDVIRRFVNPGQSYMPLVWDLFEVSQKNKESVVVTENDPEYTDKICRFKVTLEQTPEEKYWSSLTWYDFRKAYQESAK